MSENIKALAALIVAKWDEWDEEAGRAATSAQNSQAYTDTMNAKVAEAIEFAIPLLIDAATLEVDQATLAKFARMQAWKEEAMQLFRAWNEVSEVLGGVSLGECRSQAALREAKRMKARIEQLEEKLKVAYILYGDPDAPKMNLGTMNAKHAPTPDPSSVPFDFFALDKSLHEVGVKS